jgi:hypothetical protein
MNLQENIIILKSIAKKIANKLHCDRHGSCVHFAEIFVEEVNEQYPELLNDFDVIEGYVNVKFGGGIPQEHTWIRLKNDDIIDPTFLQFNKYDNNAQYSKKRTKVYSGQEYYNEGKEGSWFSERRKKLPSSVFKEEKKESIKRILREETNIKPVLNDLLNLLFDGFDDIYYDWAEYNCGMGVCCDPYAVGFVLPKNEYNDYLFLLVDYDNYDHNGDYPKEISDELPEVCYESPDVRNPNFNTIIFYYIFSEEIENYLGSESNWALVLLDLINEKFGCNATNIMLI